MSNIRLLIAHERSRSFFKMPYYQTHPEHIDYLGVIRDRIQMSIYTPLCNLEAMCWVTREPVPFARRHSGRKLRVKAGSRWGRLWDCAWFYICGAVPASAAGRRVVIRVDLRGEACLVDDHGNPSLGLTTAESRGVPSLGNPGKCVIAPWPAPVAGNERFDFWLDASCNDLFGADLGGKIKELALAEFHPQLNALFYDFAVLYELLLTLPTDRARYFKVIDALTEAAKLMVQYDESEAESARRILAPELARRGPTPPPFTISALGHGHLDLAWCWPIRETIRKGARTFATQLALMQRYSDYQFCASQPQLYLWIKDSYPALYERIRKAVTNGRWHPVGAMWVESDVNLPSGESLVRQLLLGIRFFRQEFGVRPQTCFLPDCFGFSAALPQIMRLAGIKYFLTQKVTWVKFLKYPHDTFHWRGIDGSTLLAHTPPFEHYSSSAAPESISTFEKRFSDKLTCPATLLLFGQGDGGGGPGEEHLESLARVRDLDGLPPVVQESVDAFFARIEQHAARYQTWEGPLDLDRHNGTFTSQARSKRYNRKLELALRELELTATLATLTSGAAYPHLQLEPIWRNLLLLQFHDILPGTSIARVHHEACADYERMHKQVADLQHAADRALTAPFKTHSSRKSHLVFNSLSWSRSEWLHVAGQWHYAKVPALGFALIGASESSQSPEHFVASTNHLENDLIRIDFDSAGWITQIHDLQSGRPLLAPGSVGNHLVLWDDHLNLKPPGHKDSWGIENAWDFPIHYDDQSPLGTFELVAAQARRDGPRAMLEQTRRFGASTLKQQIILTAGSKRIDFVTSVDWRERHKMLRTSFQLDLPGAQATTEVQFGHVRRNTHRNTAQDFGKFESCAHKWADLSRPDYGVALLNDCKYGYQLFDQTLDLNLLRSPGMPDPTADLGRHQFSYALLPHLGDLRTGGVVQAGYDFNIPLRIIKTPHPLDPSALPKPIVQLSGAESIVLETVKQSEDGAGCILRFYESHGVDARVQVSPNFLFSAATIVDLLEEELTNAETHDGHVVIGFRPFEIKTLKLACKPRVAHRRGKTAPGKART